MSVLWQLKVMQYHKINVYSKACKSIQFNLITQNGSSHLKNLFFVISTGLQSKWPIPNWWLIYAGGIRLEHAQTNACWWMLTFIICLRSCVWSSITDSAGTVLRTKKMKGTMSFGVLSLCWVSCTVKMKAPIWSLFLLSFKLFIRLGDLVAWAKTDCLSMQNWTHLHKMFNNQSI